MNWGAELADAERELRRHRSRERALVASMLLIAITGVILQLIAPSLSHRVNLHPNWSDPAVSGTRLAGMATVGVALVGFWPWVKVSRHIAIARTRIDRARMHITTAPRNDKLLH